MNHALITKIMHSRAVLILSVMVAAVCGLIAYMRAGATGVVETRGFVSGWTIGVGLPQEAVIGIAAALNAAIVLLVLYINKVYNVLRTMTRLNASIFLVMQTATPLALYALCPGLALALVVLWCVSLMYGLYGQAPCDTRKVFLVFFLLSACSACNYAYTIYIPVFVLVCMQLRVMQLRTAIAVVLGLITPWILLLGFGLVDVSQLQMPYSAPALDAYGSSQGVMLIAAVALTVIVAVVSLMFNVVKFIAYNAQSRSMISVMTVLTIVSAVAALVDVGNIYSYTALLNVCAAFQFTHLFTAIYHQGRSYITIIATAVVYLAVYAISLFV